MRIYVMITGLIFGLVVLAHGARMYLEPHLAADPGYIALTLMATLLTVWAARLVWRSRSSPNV